MNFRKVTPCLTAALIFLLMNIPTTGQVNVDPVGITSAIEADDTLLVDLSLANSGEEDVVFRIDYYLVEDEENNRGGPRRDDLGDVIHEFNIEGFDVNQQKVGVEWDSDNHWMWIANNANSIVVAIDPADDYNIARTIDVATPFNVTCLYGQLYIINGDMSGLFHYTTDGENLGNIDVNFTVSAITSSEELGLLFIQNDNGRVIHVFNIDDEGVPDEELGIIDGLIDLCDGNQTYRSSCWVDLHTNGQLWLSNNGNEDTGGHLYQILIDTEEWEPVEVVQDCQWWDGAAQNRQRFGIGHDGTNIWTTSYSLAPVRIVDDGIREFHLLEFDPGEGAIPQGESVAIETQIVSTGMEAGVYNMLVEIQLSEAGDERDDLEQSLIQISALVTVDDPTFAISGAVIEDADDDPIEGAAVSPERYFITRFSDEEGNYVLTDLPAGDYTVTFNATDFLPAIEEVTIEDGDVELNVALLFAEFVPDRESIDCSLEPDMSQDFDLVASNPGNGTLTYSVERRLIGDAEADPWTLLFEVDAEDSTGDNQLNGVVVVDGLIYISGGNRNEDINLIHVFDQERELVRQFEQFFESRYGMRDLTYDGETIWGADETTLYGFNTEGELIDTIAGQARSYRSLTWDKDQGLFWSADVASDIYATNPENGEVVETIDIPVELRVYGLSYWPDDPDGYCLYIFTRGDREEIECQINKLNIETGEMMVVKEFENVSGRSAGINITNQFDVQSFVLAGIVQNPDRLMVWQVLGLKDWFTIEPTEGQIDAGGEENFAVTLDATDITVDNTLNGEFVFTHDGIGEQTVIPVTLTVEEGEIWTTRELDLNLGWNTVSVNLQPDSTNVEYLTVELVNAGLLEIMKDDEGHFYAPEFGHNDIEGWFVQEGYMLKMTGEARLELQGITVLQNQPIDLHEGWQLISYYPNNSVEATLALSDIVEHLIICKDGFGNFYIPEWDFSNIGEMEMGQGYFIKMDADDELIYTVVDGDDEAAFAGVHHRSVYEEPGTLPVHPVTGRNMSLLVNTEVDVDAEVAVFAGDALVGSGVLQDCRCGIAIWGDDPTTDEMDGALDGQALTLKLMVNGKLTDVDCEILSGEFIYNTNALAVVEIDMDSIIPIEFGITSAYPNPFNSLIRLGYSLPEASDIRLAVYDITGRLVTELVSGRVQAGIHMIIFDGVDLSSGVYIVRLSTVGQMSQAKVILLK